jgi:hypothetical protein
MPGSGAVSLLALPPPIQLLLLLLPPQMSIELLLYIANG